jgi:hypothetical protein
VKGKLPGLIAVGLTSLSLFSLAGYQITSAQPATRLLGRQSAALVELDRWLPGHREDLELLARDRPQNVLAVKDLPLSLTVSSATVLDPDPDALRRAIVRAMGVTLYQDGNTAFRDDQGNRRMPGLDEPIRWSADLLGRGAHGFWQAALALSLLVLLASVAAVLMSGNSPIMPLALGASLSTGLSLLVWLVAGGVEDAVGAPVDKEIMLSLRSGAWIGIRNAAAIAFVMVGLQLLISTFSRGDRFWRGEYAYWDVADAEADVDAPTV